MNTFNIVFGQLLHFFLLLMVGMLLAKLKIVTADFLPQLSRLLTKVLLPVYIFNSTLGDMTFSDFVQHLPVLWMIFGVYLGLAAMFPILARILPIPVSRKRLFQALFVFGNTAMIATPLISEVCPDNGKIYVTFLLIVDTLLLWTYGVWLASDRERQSQIRIKNFINPTVITLAISFILTITGIQLPMPITKALVSIGNVCSPMCLMYLGMLFYYSDIRKVLKCPETYVGIIMKMFLIPIALGFLLQLTSMDSETINMLVVVSGLPTVTVMPLFASTYSSEGEYATGITMLTILISMASLPIVAFIAMA